MDSEEKRFSVEGKPEVKLTTGDGPIEIRTWDRPEVHVLVEKHGLTKRAISDIQVTSSQDGNRVSVEVRVHGRRDNFGLFWGNPWARARLIVSLPSASDLQALTGDGSIDLDGVKGNISLRSGDGRIRARDASGNIAARSGDGSITLDGVTGAVEAGTDDGRINVRGVISGLHARTGDGSVVVHAQSGIATETDWDIESGDGRVTLEVPDGFGAELDARTGDGRVHLDGLAMSMVEREHRRNRARGRIGSGGRAVRIRTGDGSIFLRGFSAAQ